MLYQLSYTRAAAILTAAAQHRQRYSPAPERARVRALIAMPSP